MPFIAFSFLYPKHVHSRHFFLRFLQSYSFVCFREACVTTIRFANDEAAFAFFRIRIILFFVSQSLRDPIASPEDSPAGLFLDVVLFVVFLERSSRVGDLVSRESCRPADLAPSAGGQHGPSRRQQSDGGTQQHGSGHPAGHGHALQLPAAPQLSGTVQRRRRRRRRRSAGGRRRGGGSGLDRIGRRNVLLLVTTTSSSSSSGGGGGGGSSGRRHVA